MLEKIKFRTGSIPSSPPLELDLTAVTVIVGPNNSGKSLFLRELDNWSKFGVASPDYNFNSRIIADVRFLPLERAEIEREYILTGINDEEKLMSTSRINAHSWGNFSELVECALDPENHRDAVVLSNNRLGTSSSFAPNAYSSFRSFYTTYFLGSSRANLLSEEELGDLSKRENRGVLSHLFINNALRKKVSDIVFDVFKKYFILDPTNVGKVRVRLSDREPESEVEEKSLTTSAVSLHQRAIPIEEFSTGVNAYVGIMASLIAKGSKIILIDEPETFLHPALATKLGRQMSQLTLQDRTMRVFAATHSTSFLMGCIQSGAPVNIVRFTYKDRIATTRLLAKDQLLNLMCNPVLRSTRVLEGLFYDAVIVTEADSDRAFYQEINERLLDAKDRRGISNCLFINAQNKQTVWDIVNPLRKLGIPAVGVVDLDIIKEGMIATLQKAFVPQLEQQPLSALATAIRDVLEKIAPSSGWKTTGGIELLVGNELSSAHSLLNQLEGFGIFLVSSGELESWLSHLAIPHEKKFWLRRMFERMGEDPLDVNYIKPASGDVWDFMGRINQWTSNSSRRGIPS